MPAWHKKPNLTQDVYNWYLSWNNLIWPESPFNIFYNVNKIVSLRENEDITFASPATKYILTLQNPVSLNHQSTSALHPQKHSTFISLSSFIKQPVKYLHFHHFSLTIILSFPPSIHRSDSSSFQYAPITFSGLKPIAFYSSGSANAQILLLQLSIHHSSAFYSAC